MVDKYIDLSGLNIVNAKGDIDWLGSIGQKIYFIYDNINSWFTIDEVIDSVYIMISGEYNKNFKIKKKNVKDCNMKMFINISTRDYLYDVGDKIKTLKIINKTRRMRNDRPHSEKAYTVQCEQCGYIYDAYETKLKRGAGCACCNSDICVTGINDIATTHPYLVDYFVNKDDVFRYTHASNVSVELKCPDCGYIKKSRVNNLYTRGFSCNRCSSDGFSYPNKFVLNALSQLTHNILPEQRFEWSNERIYDIYIPNISCIVENHGSQHYKSATGIFSGLEHQKANDGYKKFLADMNGIEHYIQLDCRRSEMEYIKKSIMDSDLPNLLKFNENDIDWAECEVAARKNIVKEACDLWSDGIDSAKEIGDILNINRNTVVKYLKQGNNIGWCNYNKS